jgi:hypothetical protein
VNEKKLDLVEAENEEVPLILERSELGRIEVF